MQTPAEIMMALRRQLLLQTYLAIVIFASAAVSLTSSDSTNTNPYSHAFYVPPQHSAFLRLARKHETDKVTIHSYKHLNSIYMETTGKRFLPLKFMEIGLGGGHMMHCRIDCG
jgi:hypothetical protein